LESEVDNYVDATWEDYDTGSINASDVISANTAMFEYGVRSGNESETLYSSTAALAMSGYDTPDLNQTGTMTVSYNGASLTGLLMARQAPNGTWEVGKTYNTIDIDGPVFMLTTDGEKIDFKDNRQFTIESMTAKDGSSLNSTQTRQYSYKTTNTSETLALQESLIELRQEIEDREPNGGGSSGGFLGGISLGGSSLAAIVAVASAALLLSREN
jgi:hypothetical protein